MNRAEDIVSFSAMRAAIERALQLDPKGDAEAACAAAAQALQQPLAAMLLVAHQAGLLTATKNAGAWTRRRTLASEPAAEEMVA
jgi:hypothetical protein